MIWLYVFIGMIVVSVIFRLKAIFCFLYPLMYGLIAPTLFFRWFHDHQVLAEGIGYGLIVLAALMWIISLVGKIVEITQKHRAMENEFLMQLELAKGNGTNEIHWDPKNVRY